MALATPRSDLSGAGQAFVQSGDGDRLQLCRAQPRMIKTLFSCMDSVGIQPDSSQHVLDSYLSPMSFRRSFALLPAALMLHGVVGSAALADTVARANGRCSLQQDGYLVFNGYCTVKQKQNGPMTVFVVDLDNGSHFRFSGPSRQQLHVETISGIQQNVLFEDKGSKGVFNWNDGRSTTRLSVKTDQVINPNAQFDDHPSTVTGSSLAGAAVGALIGALLSGGKSANPSVAVVGQPVAEFQNLIGSDPGYVESRLTGSGYTYIRTTPRENGADSFWKRGGSCVDVRTILNRYQSFTYANPSNCN